MDIRIPFLPGKGEDKRATRVPAPVSALTKALRKQAKASNKDGRVKALKAAQTAPVLRRPTRLLTPAASAGGNNTASAFPHLIVRTVLPLECQKGIGALIAAVQKKYPGGKITTAEKAGQSPDVDRVVEVFINHTGGAVPLGTVLFKNPDQNGNATNIALQPVKARIVGNTFEVVVPGTPVWGRLQSPHTKNQGRDRSFTQPGK